MKVQFRFQPYLIWGCAALFYMYQFVLRVSPSVMMEDLMTFFQISAAEIGTLSALALYAYSILQIPSGVLADVFGVRKVILTSLFLCVLGVTLFISSPNLALAKLGRVLLGSGSAAAFLCLSKISTQLFSPNRRATLFGLTMAVGTIGALNGSMPLSFLIHFVGWRQCLAVIVGIGILILGLNAMFLREHPTPAATSGEEKNLDFKGILSTVIHTMKIRACWVNGIAALGIYLSVSVIADLWGVSFLMQAYQVSKTTAAQAVSLIYVGLCTGSLVLTFVSDLLKRRKAVIFLCTLGLFFGLSGLIYLTHLPFSLVMTLLFLIGFFSGAEMLCFASASDQTSIQYSGTVTGFINCIVMSGGAFFQQQVGRLLDFFWSGQMTPAGLRLYTTAEYQSALSLVIGIILISVGATFWIPEQKRIGASSNDTNDH